MQNNDPIAVARGLPQGAVFHRCALQVNPHGYASNFRGTAASGDPATHARAVVDQALELGISVLAITDHNSVSGVEDFRRAAGDRLVVFPGFELGSSEGIHLLCIYPPASAPSLLERFLGEFGITNPGPSSDLTNWAFSAIVDKVHEQGGIAIAAHVSHNNGLFQALHGDACIRAWQSETLLAIQIPGEIDDLPHHLQQIVRNRDPNYARTHAPEKDLAIAVINAKDVVAPADLADPAATCWIKMSEVGIEGLRQAFLDPASRLRLNPRSAPLARQEHTALLALAWEGGGFLDGAAVHFNPNLNVLVGGRGSGKSTVIESIRAVLGLAPMGDEARKAHEGIVRQVLKSGTRISLLVRTHRPTPREYRIERTIPNPPLVRESSGEVSNLLPQDILPRIEVFGQHEISELTRSRDKLTRLLDRFVERDDALPQRKANLRRELEKSRRSLLDVRAEAKGIEERLGALPALEETLQRFREAGLEERLSEQSLLVREEKLLESIPERLAPFTECLHALRRELPFDRTFVSARALEDLPGKDVLAGLDEVFVTLEADLQQTVKQLAAAITRAEQGVAAVQTAWEQRRQAVQAAYAKILRELQKSRVDGEEFIRLRRQIEELRPLRQRQALLQRLEREHAERRRKLLVEWEELKADEFRRLDRAAASVSRKLQDRVQVQVTAAADREPLFLILRERVGGRLSEAIDTLRSLPDLSLTRFVDACRSGGADFVVDFGIPAAQAERLARAEPEVLMHIEELELASSTTIRLNTAAPGEPPVWQALDDLSTGQKATAVLFLLLLESDAPLIVDQPEDDLDNRFISEGVVPRMRAEKQRRQFIFSTHNANIPVLGDAELIVGLAASGEAERGRASIDRQHMGSIDAPPVCALVEEILEGGRAAFERRRRKYGF